MNDVTRYSAHVDDDGYHNPSAEWEVDPNGQFVSYDDYKALESRLDAIRLKCLDELKHSGKSEFESGRMNFADVIWRMVEQGPVRELFAEVREGLESIRPIAVERHEIK